jgi:hypothetical protein
LIRSSRWDRRVVTACGVFAVLGARTFDRASDRSRLLARAHPSGQWIEWFSPQLDDFSG